MWISTEDEEMSAPGTQKMELANTAAMAGVMKKIGSVDGFVFENFEAAACEEGSLKSSGSSANVKQVIVN